MADSADFTTTPPATPVNKQAPDLKSGGDTWPDRISALLKPALGDVLHTEQSKRRLCPDWITARAQIGKSGYAAFERGKSEPNLSKFIAIAWALDQDPRVLLDKLLTQMGFPNGTRPIM